MIYTIKRFSNKRVILITLFLSIIMGCLLVLIPIYIGYFNDVFAISGIVISIIIISIGNILFSQKILIIKLDNDKFELEGRKIPLLEINGFFISKKSPITTQFELRTTSNNIELTVFNFGKSGKIFKSFISELLEKAAKANPNIKELSYYDLHPSDRKSEKTFLSILIALGVVFPFIYLYFIYFRDVKFVWQIFLVDLTYIAIFAKRKYDL